MSEVPPPHRGFQERVGKLKTLFSRGIDAPLDDESFRRLALEAFRYQVRRNPVYGAFVRNRGLDPERVERWEEVPAVPTRAFKILPLVSGDPERVEAVFRTSGTTRGPDQRGEHHILDLELYRASLLPNFRAHLLPDGARLPLFSLTPSPRRAPESSLSHMVGVVKEELAAPGGGYFVDPDGGIREKEIGVGLREAQEEERPVLLVGTAFAFVHWLDALARAGRRFSLPLGSRVMETGGFKGRSRIVSREELYEEMEERLGVPTRRIVNEYGMTELLSQFYEPVLRTGDPDDRWKVSPPWVRTRVLDPSSLEPLSDGREGLLCHFDLANLGSVCRVLTEDLGVAEEGRFRLVGRVRGAEPRGCSLAMDDLLRARERRG